MFRWAQKEDERGQASNIQPSPAVLRIRIRIRRNHMFVGLPDPDSLVRDTNPDPSSSKNSKKNIDSYCFVTSE